MRIRYLSRLPDRKVLLLRLRSGAAVVESLKRYRTLKDVDLLSVLSVYSPLRKRTLKPDVGRPKLSILWCAVCITTADKSAVLQNVKIVLQSKRSTRFEFTELYSVLRLLVGVSFVSERFTALRRRVVDHDNRNLVSSYNGRRFVIFSTDYFMSNRDR